MSVEIAAADELANKRVGRNELLVDKAEKLKRRKHGAQLVIAFDAPRGWRRRGLWPFRS